MKLASYVFTPALLALAACGGGGMVNMLTMVDPNSTWTVAASSAQINADEGGSPWDIDNSAPDIVVRLKCPSSGGGSTTAETPEVQSYTPSWSGGGCMGKAIDLVEDGVELEVVDIDDVSITGDDEVTSTRFYILENDLLSGSKTLTTSQYLTSMSVKLTKQGGGMM